MKQLLDYPELQAAARARQPRVALVLGSGLGELAERLGDVVELPFGRAPGLDAAGVPGHRGTLLLGTWADVPVLVFAGRLHYYEGHPWRRVVQPIHLAHELGASILLVTNAAGVIAIRDDIKPGDLMVIRDHIEWTSSAGYPSEATHSIQPRQACIVASPYSGRLLALLRQIDPSLPTGVYAQVTGPCYETPAEVKALFVCGADAVGMSTAREVQAGHDLGMECAALSCITNLAAGHGSGPIHHEEVLETGRRVKDRLIRLVETFLAEL